MRHLQAMTDEELMQAEYKDSEVYSLSRRLAAVTEENKRLREALEEIAAQCMPVGYDVGHPVAYGIAARALAGKEDEGE